jgi:dipeptide/tripeptide permease
MAFSNAAYALSGYLGLAYAALVSLGMIAFFKFARNGIAPNDDQLKVISLAAGLAFVALATGMRHRFRRHLYQLQAGERSESPQDKRFWFYFRAISIGSLVLALMLTLLTWPPV